MLLEVKKDRSTKSVSDIYNKYLLGQDVWLFREYLKSKDPSKTYDDFKLFISDKLSIHFNNIAITGSSKTGISFSPGKKLRPFIKGSASEKGSDLDIILVSEQHFNLFGNAYLNMFYSQTPFPEYQAVSAALFKGFISLKDPTEKHKVIKEWLKTVNPFIKDLQLFFGIDRDINYRIYKSWDAVKQYHFFGIKQLKNYVQNIQPKEALILRIIEIIKESKNDNSK